MSVVDFISTSSLRLCVNPEDYFVDSTSINTPEIRQAVVHLEYNPTAAHDGTLNLLAFSCFICSNTYKLINWLK